MTSAASPQPRPPEVANGFWTLLTSAITIVIVLVGTLQIEPRLSERRLRIDERYILTSEEVAALPPETLAVVLDRSPGQDQTGFRYRLLQLVLERSGRPFALGLSEQIQSQDEAVAALQQGPASSRNPFAISVGVYGAGLELNRRLREIPIPVTGGILGLRVGWSHRSQHERLASVGSVEDLRSVVLLQGLGWSDVEIFDASGLRTFTARSEDLFRLVDNRRVQLFPRGIDELEREATIVASTAAGTDLDPNLLITYPFAGFFYVSPDNQSLADAIQLGFERAIADGSYQQLLEELILTPWLRRHLALADRRVIALPNPVAADVLVDVDPRHWIVPWTDLLQGRIRTGAQFCTEQRLQVLCP